MHVHRLSEAKWPECHFHSSPKTVQSRRCRAICQGTVSEWELFSCLIFEFSIGNYVLHYMFNGDGKNGLSYRMWAVVSKQFSV